MLDNTPDPSTFLQDVTSKTNIAGDMSSAMLASIAEDVLREYRIDKASMREWLDLMQRGIDLAKLVKKDKAYPFPNSSNVKYPLITSAALQFNARAYPAICAPAQVVKVKTHGADPQGAKAARAERVSAHMSWQLSSQIEEWEEETDKLLVQLPIVGNMVRKVWYDTVQSRPRCRVIDPGKFIVNDGAKTLNDIPRCTEEMSLYPAEIIERKTAGLFLDVALEEPETDDKSAPHEFVEQHRRIDLDGDGYPEPYIVTVHVRSEQVVRILADFEDTDVIYETQTQTIETEKLIQDPVTGGVTLAMVPEQIEVPVGVKSITRGSYFVSYQFLPSMDGGFHGTGLGLLLGDISESINSIINMLMDAGHMSSLGGGFLGSDFKIKGASQRFRPGEWKKLSATGGAIKDSIVPMAFPQPDATLFQMLGMLIEAGREIASVKDVMTGDSGQRQMTATTTIALIEQGMMVFTAAYKRIFRAMKREFKLLAKINAETVDPEKYAQFHDEPPQEPGQMGHNGGPPLDPAHDYGAEDMDIEPVADPQSVTKMQQVAKAQMLMQMAEQGLVDKGEASKRIIEATDIGDSEDLAPKPDPMQEEMMRLQAEFEAAKAQAGTMKAQADTMKAQAEMLKAKTEAISAQSGDDTEARKQQIDAEIATMKMQQETMLERERMALDRQQSIEANILAVTLKQMEINAQR